MSARFGGGVGEEARLGRGVPPHFSSVGDVRVQRISADRSVSRHEFLQEDVAARNLGQVHAVQVHFLLADHGGCLHLIW